MSDPVDPAAGIRSLLARTVRALEEAGVRDEALADFVTRKRMLGIARSPVMLPRARVWPLGVLLLGRDGSLHATGKVTRAVPEGYPGYQSPGIEVRRGYRAAAHNGKFVEGDTVNFDTVGIDLGGLSAGTTPLFLGGFGDVGDSADGYGDVRVRWNPTHPSQSRPLAVYLADRASLLIDPPGEN